MVNLTAIVAPTACLLFYIALYLVYRWKRANFEYKGKHVVVTGGSSGIGLELAKYYMALGARVTIVARDVDKLLEA